MGKRGPKPNPEGWRSERLIVRMTVAELAAVRAAAGVNGVAVAEYVRDALQASFKEQTSRPEVRQ